jgi:hypothetical protein
MPPADPEIAAGAFGLFLSADVNQPPGPSKKGNASGLLLLLPINPHFSLKPRGEAKSALGPALASSRGTSRRWI